MTIFILLSTLVCAKRLNALDRIRFVHLPEKTLLYTALATENGRTLAERCDRAFVKVGGTQTCLRILSKYIDVNDLYPDG